MIFGAILAGGIGSRMNMTDMPKQFLNLGERPIIIHTLEKFILCAGLDEIYVGVHSNWILHMEDLINKYVPLKKDKIHVVAGGNDRNSTIMNIINEIENVHGVSSEHHIITHDSVRPFVSARILEENIELVVKYKACDTVIEATDTIVISDNGNTITDIPARNLMYQGQTPQSFQIELLKTLYNSLDEKRKEELTDACKIAVICNHPVHLVKGETSNMKITTISDYNVAQAMVGGKLID